jgi:hypothetical protein
MTRRCAGSYAVRRLSIAATPADRTDPEAGLAGIPARRRIARPASSAQFARIAAARPTVGSIVSTRKPRRTPHQLAQAVQGGRNVAEALRHLDVHGSEPGATLVADALARFLVERCESHHTGWRVVRQVVVDSATDAPWEKCARRAIPQVAEDLLTMSSERGRTPLLRAQHVAAIRRAEQIAGHVDQAAILSDLGLDPPAVTAERWRTALGSAVRARSREQVARAVDVSLRA